MKKIRWQLLIIFIAGLVVGILLLTEQPGASVNSPEPAKGGVYTEALIGSLQRLNPLLDSGNPVDKDVDRLIFSSLLRFDSRGLAVGEIAESWGQSDDGTIVNVTLRNGAVWHDGEAVTADDVAFTIDLIRNGGDFIAPDLQSFWQDVEVKVLSDTAIQFKLPEAFAPFLDYLTFGILPKHKLDGMTIAEIADSDFNMAPIGSGPYKFDRLIVEDKQITGVVLLANDKYFGDGPYINSIVFRYYPDSESAWTAAQDGLVQGISNVSDSILPGVLANPNLSVYTTRKPEISMVILNLNNAKTAFLKDSALRKALLTGINRQLIIDRILNGQATIADGPILPGTWAYYEQTPRIGYDAVQAAAMLKDAGYELADDEATVLMKDKIEISFTMLYPDDETHRKVAEEIQREWAELKVQVNIEAVAYEDLINNRLATHDYEAALVDLNLMNAPDPDPYPFWDQGQISEGQNYSQWDNRMASEYLEQARLTPDFNTRVKYYNNFQLIFANELPALPLFTPQYSYAVSTDVQGVQLGPLYNTDDRFMTVTSWYLLSQRSGQPTALPTTGTGK